MKESCKEVYYYYAHPKAIRIRSEKLCLDHTFYTDLSKPGFTFEDIQELISNPMIDELWIKPRYKTLLYEDVHGVLQSCDCGRWLPLKSPEFDSLNEHVLIKLDSLDSSEYKLHESLY